MDAERVAHPVVQEGRVSVRLCRAAISTTPLRMTALRLK